MARDIVTLDNVYENNLGILVKIAQVVHPDIEYPDNFFQELFPKDSKKDTKKEAFFTKLSYYSEIPVGAIKSKLYPKKKGDNYPKGVHIELFAVLEQYEDKGIEVKFFEYVEEQCKNHHQHSVYTHVPVTDETAIKFFKSNGFEQDGEILKDLIKTIDGAVDALLLKKHIP